MTVTYRTTRTDSLAGIRDVNHALGPLVDRAFWAVEPHRLAGIHLHGLVHARRIGPDQVNGPIPAHGEAFYIYRRLFQRFGRSKVSAINHRYSTAMYCSKYVVKGGYEYDFFGNQSAWG